MKMRARWEGVKKSERYADVICTSPLREGAKGLLLLLSTSPAAARSMIEGDDSIAVRRFDIISIVPLPPSLPPFTPFVLSHERRR